MTGNNDRRNDGWEWQKKKTEEMTKEMTEITEKMTDKKDPKMSENPTEEDLEKFGISDERHWIK